jgi:hypothetical protein
MARVSDGCVTLHLSAALVKFSSPTVARKYLTCCISIAAVCPLDRTWTLSSFGHSVSQYSAE